MREKKKRGIFAHFCFHPNLVISSSSNSREGARQKRDAVVVFSSIKHRWIFPLYFQLPYLPEDTCFQEAGSSAVEGTSQAVLGSADQQKVPTSLSPFLKSEKIPALLYLEKGPHYKPFCDFRPVPSAYRPGAQISNHRRACTKALPLYKTLSSM
jgi:hypothetical protein